MLNESLLDTRAKPVIQSRVAKLVNAQRKTKVESVLQTVMFLILWVAATGTRANAQGLGLSVTTSADSIAVSNLLTYTIYVTNATGLTVDGVFVTNTPSAGVLLVSSSPSGTIDTTSNSFVFSLGTLFDGTVTPMTLTIEPTVAGLLTNTLTVSTLTFTNLTTIFAVTDVTNTLSDLAVSVTSSSSSAYVNDLVTYTITVSNLGPSDASGVILNNSFSPATFKPISSSPVSVFNDGTIVYNLASLTNLGVSTFVLTIQPTNEATLSFTATVSSTGATDPNLANNTASVNTVVSSYLSTNLVAIPVSTNQLNPQNGFIEQSILLTNTGTNAVPSARVIVSGLTNRLINGVGTNNGNPYVDYANTLDTNQSVFLLLQFVTHTRLPFPVSPTNLQALGVSTVNLAPPATLGAAVPINRILNLSSGRVLVEFPSTAGGNYVVLYSSDLGSTNWLAAQPYVIDAAANIVQWFDYGPPLTISAPTNTSARFYRVYQNP